MKLPEFGPHAKQRWAYHNITTSQVAAALIYGVTRVAEDSTFYHVGPEITLVVAPQLNFIVTMFPNKWADRFHALNAAIRQKEAQDEKDYCNQPTIEEKA